MGCSGSKKDDEEEPVEEVLELPKHGHPSRLRRARAANVKRRAQQSSKHLVTLAEQSEAR